MDIIPFVAGSEATFRGHNPHCGGNAPTILKFAPREPDPGPDLYVEHFEKISVGRKKLHFHYDLWASGRCPFPSIPHWDFDADVSVRIEDPATGKVYFPDRLRSKAKPAKSIDHAI